MAKSKTLIHLQFTEDSTQRLRGHQSVRTTFKLSERSINALSILAGQMGIKQKSLFDHLVDDVQALQAIASGFETFPGSEHRVAKTYVISRKTLENLEQISSKYNTPRDALVEFSIERILPLIEKEKAKYSRRVEIARKLKNMAEQSAALLQEAAADLGEEDPVVQEMHTMARSTEAAFQRICIFLEKARRIETF